ncbi:MAG: DUF2330 domain-containing protein [bacterium]
MKRLVLGALLASMPATASAFCGFFVSGADAKLTNNASQVALMRKGQRTVISMSNTYQGPLEDFAMVVPVPVVLQKEMVKTLPHDVFEKIDQLSAPRLVEYWEQDPCELIQVRERFVRTSAMPPPVAMAAPASAAYGVTIEAQFKAGEYEVLILSAEEATGLERWLHENHYTIPVGASEALAPYIQGGMKFFVAKVDVKAVKKNAHGDVVLSPLRFTYEEDQLRLPVRLGLLNASGQQDLIVYVLHPTSRFEVANYKNIFIPSNLEVLDETRKDFGGFYADLFDATLASAGGAAVVTEYAWQTTSCDPCPVPPLQPSDLYTLGGDVLGEGEAGGGRRVPGQPGQPFFGPASSWTLTRLHTRYDRKSLTEDLVFVPARPVVGGRGNAGLSQEQPGAVELAAVNSFQGRYIIRHYWAGEVKCEHPTWGIWGGPPAGGQQTKAATDLANATRGAVKLADVVQSTLPQLGLPGLPEPSRPGRK